jgi:hypothetical protein
VEELQWECMEFATEGSRRGAQLRGRVQSRDSHAQPGCRTDPRSDIPHAHFFCFTYIRTSLFDCNLSHPIRYVVVGDRVLCSDVVSVSVIESVFKALSRAMNGVFERLECEYSRLRKKIESRDFDTQFF